MKKLLGLVAGFLAATSANAAVITFDSIPSIGYSAYVEAGYEFWFTDNSGSSHTGDFGSFSGDLAWHSSTTYNIDMTITKVGGGLFDLNSLFLNTGSDLNAVLVTDQGDFSFTGYGQNDLNITGVSYVTFDMSYDRCCSTGISIDNVVVDEATVSEPATIALLGLGLAGIGAARRRKTA